MGRPELVPSFAIRPSPCRMPCVLHLLTIALYK
jgi:hypothetical protein